ncbi:hypothetical protein JCM21900_004753 [Sporobolomyces salmonicolor]
MPLPLVSSAYLAQQAIRSATSSSSASSSASSSIASLAHGDGGKWHSDDDEYGMNSDTTEDESDRDDDTAFMVDERFLDPNSEAGIATRISGYCASLSPLGRHYALELPRDVLQAATQCCSETLNSGILTVRAQRGDQVLAVCHARISPDEEIEWNAFHSSTAPSPRAPSSRTSSPPSSSSSSSSFSSSSADRTPRRVRNRHLHLPTPAADHDQSTAPPPRAESALSVSSAVVHPHTLPLAAPPPPRRRPSPSPPVSGSSTAPSAPGARDRPPSGAAADAEEEDAAAGRGADDDGERTTAALSALLDQVLAQAVERDPDASARARRGPRPPGDDEFVFELREEEEEVEEEVEDEEERVQRRRRRSSVRPRENVGR